MSVYVDEDWEEFYRNPSVRVKCREVTCETLLTAKQMRKSGRRFFAVRSGGCSHNEVDVPVSSGDVAVDAAPPVGGGGLESDEHIWFKSRFFAIARAVGLEAIIEHQPTHADVYLPAPRIVLEYQRWNTEFSGRTRARVAAGARTLWMFPEPPRSASRTKKYRAFYEQVFERGGLFVAARKGTRWGELQRPWEDSRLNRSTRLYVSGSTVEYVEKTQRLQRRPVSLATFMEGVASGKWVLTEAEVLSGDTMQRRRVWVRRDHLARAEQEKNARLEARQKERERLDAAKAAQPPAPDPAPDAAHALATVPTAPPPHPVIATPIVPMHVGLPASRPSIWRRIVEKFRRS